VTPGKRAHAGARVEHAATSGRRGKVERVFRRHDGAWCLVRWGDGTLSETHCSFLLYVPKTTQT
jgi:hypothetical protein